jgi:hypothetical protein
MVLQVTLLLQISAMALDRLRRERPGGTASRSDTVTIFAIFLTDAEGGHASRRHRRQYGYQQARF